MKSVLYSTVALLTLLTLLTSNFANAITQAGNEAKQEIFTDLSKIPFEQYRNVTAGLHNGSIITIYNQSEAPPIVNDTEPPVINETEPPVINDTEPPQPVCPPNQVYNETSQLCQDVPPLPPLPSDRPAESVNLSKTLRVATVGDIDLNSGLDKQLALAVKYHTQVFIVVGDYGYKDCQKVVDKIHQAGFDKNNAVIIRGNHDCSDITKAFNGGWVYGNTNHPDIAALFSVFAIDGNQKLDCSSTQFKEMKDKLD